VLWFHSCFPCSEASSSGVDRKWEGFLAAQPTAPSHGTFTEQVTGYLSGSATFLITRRHLFGFHYSGCFGLCLVWNCPQHIMVSERK
jgi:hypothetical protein